MEALLSDEPTAAKIYSRCAARVGSPLVSTLERKRGEVTVATSMNIWRERSSGMDIELRIDSELIELTRVGTP